MPAQTTTVTTATAQPVPVWLFHPNFLLPFAIQMT